MVEDHSESAQQQLWHRWRNQGTGGALPLQISADLLNLSQPGREDYAHHILSCSSRFSDLPPYLHDHNIGFLIQPL